MKETQAQKTAEANTIKQQEASNNLSNQTNLIKKNPSQLFYTNA